MRKFDSSEYQAWSQIYQRCYNPNNPQYPSVGGTGIKMHADWKDDPDAFVQYIGTRPSRKHAISRHDFDKDFEPGNVFWELRASQIGRQMQRSKKSSKHLGVLFYKPHLAWAAITPNHPKRKKFKWIGRWYFTEEEALEARQKWIGDHWPTFPEGTPNIDW